MLSFKGPLKGAIGATYSGPFRLAGLSEVRGLAVQLGHPNWGYDTYKPIK